MIYVHTSTDLSALLGNNSCFTHDSNPTVSSNEKVLWRYNTIQENEWVDSNTYCEYTAIHMLHTMVVDHMYA